MTYHRFMNTVSSCYSDLLTWIIPKTLYTLYLLFSCMCKFFRIVMSPLTCVSFKLFLSLFPLFCLPSFRFFINYLLFLCFTLFFFFGLFFYEGADQLKEETQQTVWSGISYRQQNFVLTIRSIPDGPWKSETVFDDRQLTPGAWPGHGSMDRQL